MKRSAGTLRIVALALLFSAGAVTWALWERCGLRGCPAVDRLDGYVPDRAAVVVDRSGAVLARLYLVPRKIVPLDSLPPYVPAAFVAIEDQRFWEHDGIDWRRMVGAAWRNLRSMRIREGFSTITMQLARNAFPDRLPYAQRTITRKFAEMRVAKQIEDRYTKRQILELYLNNIYFGSGAWGIGAAAQEYFRKSASALTLAEAALLAGMVTAPNGLNPRTNPVFAYRRRWVVLNVMWRQGVIAEDAANAASSSPLLTDESTMEPPDLAPYFVEEVRQYLDREIGDALYTGGYTIHTTLDSELQAVAETELRAQLAAVEAGRFGRYEHPIYAPWPAGEPRDGSPADSGAARRRGSGTDYLQGAVVVLDVESGDVLAMVGGRDYSDSRFNRAVRARRQSASTFKPFIYALALGSGYTPIDQLDDTPIRRDMGGGRIWEPRNYDDRYAAAISVRDALVESSNVATIRLAEDIGLGRVAALAHRMGLTGPFPLVPALALGTAEVTLLELTAAYTAFATLGRRPDPRIATRVEDADGRVIWQREPRVREVLDPGVAFLVTDIMRDVVNRGTGHGVRTAGFRGPAAGKTGTASNATDYWFVGFTPRRVAGIWIGLDLPRPVLDGTAGHRIVPPLWGRIMGRTMTGREQTWTPPPTIEARRIDGAGRIYASTCRLETAGRTEYFLVDNAPIDEGCGGGPDPTPVPGPGADSLAIPATDRPDAAPRPRPR